MIDLEYKRLEKGGANGVDLQALGLWLDENMPNPPLPEEQRWTIGRSADGRIGIRFANDHDATLFSLRWG
jgi:hypothetical protein